ncbi:hypothetical protein [Wolbachia endosymbiont (group A) of Epistrophe grossularia]|nr:hypothetical protein [Wolbachia endosymbiont (group A) of Epistrophe grossularia]
MRYLLSEVRCNKAHWDPENLTLNKWLHNKGWIPDWNDIICYTLE